MATQWPSPGDYSAAVQNPRNCFNDPELQQGSPSYNKLGLPIGASGNFAVVYQIRSLSRSFAVRCFSRPVTDQRKRYADLGKHFAGFSLPALVDFSYLPDGIRIRGAAYPVVRMEWVAGHQLHSYLDSHLKDTETLRVLASQWRGIIAGLRGAHSAHGDLQHGNVLVDSTGQIRLVDYDGFFIPSLSGCPPGEVGHPNYQHPERLEYGQYDEDIDNFSALVVYLSFLALRSDPSLWRFHNGENLIFLADDFKQPGKSDIWKQLNGNPSAEVQRLTSELANYCRTHPSNVPDLEAVLQGLSKRASVGPVKSKQAVLTRDEPSAPPLVQRLEEVRSHVSVALMDGTLSPEEKSYIQELGRRLRVSPDDVDKIIREEVRKRPGIEAANSSRKPQLELSKSRFDFLDLRRGSIVSESFVLSNVGGGNLQGSISSSQPWLQLSRAQIDSTSHRQRIDFTVDSSNLTLGSSQSCAIHIHSNGGNETVSVVVSIEIEKNALSRFRRVLSSCGFLLGGLVGFVFYSLAPDPATGNAIAMVAGAAASLSAVIAGALMGKWGGGIGAALLASIAASALSATSMTAYSAGAWATIFGALLYICSRSLFVAKHAAKSGPVIGVSLGGLAITLGIISFGAYTAHIPRPPLQVGTVTTCSSVRGPHDFTAKNEFRAGEPVCAYAEALNVRENNRIDVSYEFELKGPDKTVYANRSVQCLLANTKFTGCEQSVPDLHLPTTAPSGSYTLQVAMRNNLTGQTGSSTTAFVVLPASKENSVGAILSEWQGEYVQGGRSTKFSLSMQQSGTKLTGEMRETQEGAGEVLSDISGELEGTSVRFVKRYRSNGGQVSYAGNLQADASAMSGTWSAMWMSGEWHMSRDMPAAVQDMKTAGTLAVQTVAGVEVSLDGIRKGTTDPQGSLLLDGIPAGSHLVLAHKDGYTDSQTNVEIIAGQRAAYAPELRILHGAARIHTLPEAEVSLDGTTQGAADSSGLFVMQELPAGRHLLVVRKAGYADGQFPVDIAPGETKTVAAPLASIGYLTVRSNFVDISVRVIGLAQFAGGIIDYPCPPGTYTVVASRAGMKTETQNVVVNAGEHSAIDFNLSPDLDLVRARLDDAEQKALGSDPRSAIQVANQILSVDSNDVRARAVLAEAYFHLKDMPNFYSSSVEVLDRGGRVNAELVHRDGSTSLHRVFLTITPSFISFNWGQIPKGCNLPKTDVQLSLIQSAEVGHNSAGEVFLQLKLREQANSARTKNIQLWVLGIHTERKQVTYGKVVVFQTMADVVVSPNDAPQILGTIVDVVSRAMTQKR